METRSDQTTPGTSSRDEFESFYRREHAEEVRRAALIIGSDALANDIVHDAFIALYGRWPEIAEPGPYLHRTVLNRCRDEARRRGRLRVLLPRLVDREPRHHDEILWDVLESLPFNQRAAVVLRFYGALTEAEIAETLGCPRGSVGPWITRALARMRKELS